MNVPKESTASAWARLMVEAKAAKRSAVPGECKPQSSAIPAPHIVRVQDETHDIDQFISQSRKAVSLMRAHLMNSDSVRWCETAQMLMTLAAGLRAPQLHCLCREAHAMRAASIESKGQQLQHIEMETKRIHAYLGIEKSLMPHSTPFFCRRLIRSMRNSTSTAAQMAQTLTEFTGY